MSPGPAVANPAHRLPQEVGGAAGGVGPPRRAAQVEALLDEFGQAQVLGEGGRKEQTGIGHQSVVVEGDLDPVGVVAW